MIAKIQRLPGWQRALVFLGLVMFVVFGFSALTIAIIVGTARSAPRVEAVSIQPEEISVREYATLPDEDAYPAAIAASTTGDIYTGSYVSGAVWRLLEDGSAEELPQTRDEIGSVSALDVASDGTLYILDRIDPLQAMGATIWQMTPDGTLSPLVTLSDDASNGVLLPDDLTIDSEGHIYLSDRGRDNVWRFNNDGTDGAVWWELATNEASFRVSITGLAYDATMNRILITDGVQNTIYAVSTDASASEQETLYRHDRPDMIPGFDGIDVSADGEIYVAALGLNRVARLSAEGELFYLAGAFRGSSDVAYDTENDRIFVTNWDQRALLPITILFLQFDMDPRLPFGIDVITFEPTGAEDTE